MERFVIAGALGFMVMCTAGFAGVAATQNVAWPDRVIAGVMAGVVGMFTLWVMADIA